MDKIKNALFLTGAAAKISQEVAIIDQLIAKRGLEINQENTLLTGFSSGALIVTAINACFRKENPLLWNDYFKGELLKNLTDNDVFIQDQPVHWNTRPLRETINRFLEEMGYTQLSDFPFCSSIITFSYKKMKTFWVGSKKKKHQYVKLSDLLMASTAIPVIFPSQHINATEGHKTGLPDSGFGDGGTGGTFKGFKKYMQYIKKKYGIIENLYIISPMRGEEQIDIKSHDLNKIHTIELERLNEFLGHISQHSFMRFLIQLKKANDNFQFARRIFVCIPNMEHNFFLIDFKNQMEKYNTIKKWAVQNPDNLSIELKEFLLHHVDYSSKDSLKLLITKAKTIIPKI